MTHKEQLINKIETAIDELRPFLQQDGGDIRLVELSEKLDVRLQFLGACKSCSMSPMTFKAGVEQAIRRAVPEIQNIEVINSE